MADLVRQLWYANYPNLGTAETYEPAKRVLRSRCELPLAIPYLVMFTKGPLHVPITSGSAVGGVTWGLRNGFDVAPHGARAPALALEAAAAAPAPAPAPRGSVRRRKCNGNGTAVCALV